jgi:NAD-reducing hydrogenase small subunit
MDPIRVATAWLGGCSGCHMSFLDLDEWLIELAGKVELVYSPIMDIKRYPEDVDLALVEGAVANEDNLELIRTIRKHTKTLVSFGDCAVNGNVTALRNPLGDAEPVLRRAYLEGADIAAQVPAEAGIVPVLLDRVHPIHEVVRVDAFLPGCPPPADRIRSILEQVLAGQPVLLAGLDLKAG